MSVTQKCSVLLQQHPPHLMTVN